MLKFLAIGLALAVLLVSQVGVDRSAEAAVASPKDGEVEFVGAPGSSDQLEEKDFFKPGDTVNFYINDDDLAQLTVNQKTTVTWYLDAGANVAAGATLNLANGEIGGNAIGESTGGLDGAVFSTSTAHKRYAPNGFLSQDTPLAKTPTVSVGEDRGDGGDGDRLVTSTDVNRGIIKIFGPVDGGNAVRDSDDKVTTATTTITVVFEYDLPDIFEADQGTGAGAPQTQNRAKVTSVSDSVGEWITITEVMGVGNTMPGPQSNLYHGSVMLSDDSSATASGDEEIYVRDGEEIKVTFYDEDDEEVGTDTAEVDAEAPLISGLSPADGVVIMDSSPVVTFTVTDDGAGFDTSSPKDHVKLVVSKFVIDEVEEDGVTVERVRETEVCEIDDDHLTATRLSRSEVEMLFRNPEGSWATGLVCIGGKTLQVDTKATGDNNHGIPFMIRVEAEDDAGNEESEDSTVTIDTKAPEFMRDTVKTGVSWDGDNEERKDDRASIIVPFTEGLDPDTVDASDFSVDDPDATVEDVIVGGTGDEKNELVFLTLSSELPSDARPRVELDGSIKDVAGNEVDEDAVPRVRDGISPDVTLDAFARQLLPKDGEVEISFTADENLSGILGPIGEDCTCLGITGGGGDQEIDGDEDVTKGDIALPEPDTGTYTFKQAKFSATGIYGIMVQATDSATNPTRVGAVKVTDEVVTADVTGNMVTFELDKWPLANAGFEDDSLAQAVNVSKSETGDFLETAGTSSTAAVVEVDWGAGTVTMDLMGHGVKTDDTLYATYSYVDAAQVIEVDTSAPTVEFEASGADEDGNTQNSRPFIRIRFNDEEYAGDTHTTVTVTSATLTDPDGNETVLKGDEVDLLSSSDRKLYSYLPDSDLALGEYTITAVGKDAAGNSSGEKSGKFKVEVRPAVSIPLNLGWNLISLPAAPDDTAIDTVINVEEVSQVLTYDPTVEGGWVAAVRVNGAFEGGLTDIDATKSYLVYTTSVDPLKVDIPGLTQGDPVFPPTIQLYKGWNMVPASSLDAAFPKRDIDSYLTGVEWSRGYYYDTDGRLVGFIPGDEEDDELVEKGRGFLIYVTEDSILVP